MLVCVTIFKEITAVPLIDSTNPTSVKKDPMTPKPPRRGPTWPSASQHSFAIQSLGVLVIPLDVGT